MDNILTTKKDTDTQTLCGQTDTIRTQHTDTLQTNRHNMDTETQTHCVQTEKYGQNTQTHCGQTDTI